MKPIPYGATSSGGLSAATTRNLPNRLPMPKPQLDINRPLTGVIAAVLLTLGFGLMLVDLGSDMVRAGFIRTGLVMGALFIALPTRNRPAAWADVTWSGVLMVLIGVIVFLSARLRWTVLPLVLAVGIAIYFLRRPLKRR